MKSAGGLGDRWREVRHSNECRLRGAGGKSGHPVEGRKA